MGNLIESSYTFRALNDIDEENISKGYLVAKKPLPNNYKLYDAMTSINSHVLHGSRQPSCWISTTSDLFVAAVRYGIPYNNCSGSRRNVAVIKDSNASQITLSDSKSIDLENYNLKSIKARLVANDFSKFEIGKIKKLVYNLSLQQHTIDLSRSGFILSKAGITSNNSYVVKYGIGSKELLILNQIEKDDIVKILNPLELDIYYSCKENYSTATYSTQLFQYLLTHKADNSLFAKDLSNIKERLFIDLYVLNKNFTDVVVSAWHTNTSCDILAVYQYFKELKKDMLKDILSNILELNVSGKVHILDDFISPIRVGDVNTTTPQTINYYNYTLTILPIRYGGKPNSSTDIYTSVAQKTQNNIFCYDEYNSFCLSSDGTYNNYITSDTRYQNISQVLLKS